MCTEWQLHQTFYLTHEPTIWAPPLNARCCANNLRSSCWAKHQFSFVLWVCDPLRSMWRHQLCKSLLCWVTVKFSTFGINVSAFIHPVMFWQALRLSPTFGKNETNKILNELMNVLNYVSLGKIQLVIFIVCILYPKKRDRRWVWIKIAKKNYFRMTF